MPDLDPPPARDTSIRDSQSSAPPDTAAAAAGSKAGHEADSRLAGSADSTRASDPGSDLGNNSRGNPGDRAVGDPVDEPVDQPVGARVGGSDVEPLMSGDLVPHFDLIDVDGRRRRYAELWQQRLLALVLLPEAESGASVAYQDSLAEIAPALAEMNTALVVASGAVAGLTPPGWLVADQFGEIQHVQQSDDPREVTLPAPDEVVQWVRYVRTRCG